MAGSYDYTISYGKLRVPVYRVYARPLAGLEAIPESAFTGRKNNLFAVEVDVEVFGKNFLPAYTVGDNTQVVATDSMKNFVLRQALAYDGATVEGLVDWLGRRFLATYEQMEALRLTARELPFAPAFVPQHTDEASTAFGASDVLFSRAHDDYGVATLDFSRAPDGSPTLTAHRCGRVNLQLMKITGSAFTSFVRDDYTTLPERGDRPLFIYFDARWTYLDPIAHMLAPSGEGYVAGEQVRDLIQTVFHEFVSESIQHLVHEIGTRILARFPQLAEISFDAQNRTRDPVAASDTDPKVKVYTDPFSAYGEIKLTMRRQS
ncbi:MAG: Uricase (urate oxidase) [Ktedonobacterales bacterium]|jgi:urate oxidase|nr:MAG: Uricase (urate oxidase) [Ktedonobacterales bacterium]